MHHARDLRARPCGTAPDLATQAARAATTNGKKTILTPGTIDKLLGSGSSASNHDAGSSSSTTRSPAAA